MSERTGTVGGEGQDVSARRNAPQIQAHRLAVAKRGNRLTGPSDHRLIEGVPRTSDDPMARRSESSLLAPLRMPGAARPLLGSGFCRGAGGLLGPAGTRLGRRLRSLRGAFGRLGLLLAD